MVTETTWSEWCASDFDEYLAVVINEFGVERVMAGSDWPVCTHAGDYLNVMKIPMDFIAEQPPEIQAEILGDNCTSFYGLEPQPIPVK